MLAAKKAASSEGRNIGKERRVEETGAAELEPMMLGEKEGEGE